MAKVANSRAGVVDFENINEIKKKSVRGLLRKRAKNYKEDEDSRDSDGSDAEQGIDFKRKNKVVRKTMASAFKMIMSKKIIEDNSDDDKDAVKASKASAEDAAEPDVILAKYKKKARDLDAKKAEEEVEKKKAAIKEK